MIRAINNSLEKFMGKKLTTAEFIERAAEIHGGKYDYSTTVYSTTYQKIAVGCPVHGAFIQVAKDHLNGYGCPVCGGTGKKTTTEFIEKSQLVHGDKYDYTLVDLKSMNKKVKIICPDHGAFMQRPADHAVGVGCPECGKRKQSGYTLEYFTNRPDTKDTPAKLYVIGVDNKFCKIGITTKQYIKQRFPGVRFVEYACVDMSLYSAFCAEQQILSKFEYGRYQIHDFKNDPHQTGWPECFPLSMVDELKMAVEAIND